MEKYREDFGSREDIAREFRAGTGSTWDEDDLFVPAADFPTDDEIIVAAYWSSGYDGSAFVLYRRDGKLFEVNGGHCSYYGLEGQWEPEETTVEALRMRNPYDVTEKRAIADAITFLEAEAGAAN